MILSESSSRKIINFETVAISPAIDPNGGYWLRLKSPQPLADKTVFEEVAETLPIKLSAKTIAYILDATLTTTALKVAKDGVPRRLGDLLKFYPVARGKVKGPYSTFNSDTCSGIVAVCALSGLERKMDMSCVRFANVRLGAVVTLSTVMTVGANEDGTIRKGAAFRAYGENLQFDAAVGDTATVEWTDEDGETQSAAITPKESDARSLTFDWPAALGEVEPGTTIAFILRTRGGIADAETQENRFEVKLVAAT